MRSPASSSALDPVPEKNMIMFKLIFERCKNITIIAEGETIGSDYIVN